VPRRSWRLRIEDTLQAVARIRTYVSALDRQAFFEDQRTVDAVIRNLEVVGEAARHVPGEIQARYPSVPWSDAVTHGRTKREAFSMAADLLETMADTKGFRATVYPTRGMSFEVGANRLGVLLALLLRRQRERQGLTLANAVRRLGQRSKNAYYEQGKTMPTVEKLEHQLAAIAPGQRIVWHLAA